MGNPTYEARREAERAEAEKQKAEADAGRAAFEAVTAFMSGRAYLHVSPNIPGMGMNIRLVRD